MSGSRVSISQASIQQAGGRRIGIFGGSFDPPHLGHSLATLWALSQGTLDEIWWVPVWSHAFDKSLSPFEDRLQLCEQAVRHLQGVRVDPIERELGGVSRTMRMIDALRERHPQAEFALVIGSDLVAELPRWERAEELMALSRVVVPRGSGSSDGNFAVPDISSTLLREAILNDNQGLQSDWMDSGVRQELSARGLFRTRKDGA